MEKTFSEWSDLEKLAKFLAKAYLPKKAKAITAKEIAKEIGDRLGEFNIRYGTSFKSMSDVSIRSAINIARKEDFCTGKEIIAGPSGYYLSDDLEDVLKQIESLEGRVSSINEAIRGLRSRTSQYKRKMKAAVVRYDRKPIQGDLFDSL